MSSNGSASAFVQYLPAPYQADDFTGRFLLIFENVYRSIEGIVDALPNYFDPQLTPLELLTWLASWVDVELDENWPLPRRRALVKHAAALYRWHGTRHALREHLRLYCGQPPLIVENFDGLRLGQDGALGVNTRLGEQRPHCIVVTVVTNPEGQINEQVMKQIIEAEKPAHVDYVLAIVEAIS